MSGMISFKKDDDYETTEDIWAYILPFLSFDKVIYEPFYCSGRSKEILNNLGYKDVIHEDVDFFTNHDKYEYDVIVSNPPFSIKKKVFDKLREIDKPFIMISPVSILTKQFFMDKYKGEDISILVPKRRMQFSKKGEVNGRCWFDCIFVCYKLGLDKQIIFLD
jgi:hypothetical protein